MKRRLIQLTLVSAMLLSLAAGMALAETLTGTQGPDNLFGTVANDTLNGLGGNDRLYGNDGDDRVSGGAGNDVISGGHNKDVLVGGLGNDYINGVGQRDFRAPDVIDCGPGIDRVIADEKDSVSANCENVSIVEDPGLRGHALPRGTK